MPSRKHSRSWKLFRIYFRRFRMGVWLVIFALIGALLYLDQIGLPDFLKKPLLEKLHERGIDLQFTRLRLRFSRGIVADNASFGHAGDAASPTLALKEIQVRLDYMALAKLKFQVSSLVLRRGRLACPVTASNQPPRELTVENIQTEVRFLPGDVWELDHFQAQFAGANIQLAGTVTNASAIRDWKIYAGQEPGRAVPPQQRLRQLADLLEQIHFPSAPDLHLDVYGDGRDPYSFGARMTLQAPGAQTPWGTLDAGVLSARVTPPNPNEPSRAEVVLRAASAQTRWATASNLNLTLHVRASADDTNFNADLKLNASRVETKWGLARTAHLTAQWLHSSTNAMPLSGHGELQLAEAETIWGNGKGLQLTGQFSSSTNAPPRVDLSWGWWTNLASRALEWECHLDKLKTPKLEASGLLCSGQWQAPEIGVTRVTAHLYDGEVTAGATLNAVTRQLSFNVSSDFDPHKIAALLPPTNRQWLAQFSWQIPPELQATGSLILPVWTNQTPDWRAEVEPTIKLRGKFQFERAAFRGVAVSLAQGHFAYSNSILRLPDAAVLRPEGRLDLVHETDERTKDFYFRIHSTIDLLALRPLLETNAQAGLDLVGFTQSPMIDGEIRGRWNDFDRISAKAMVTVTNFTVRGQWASWLETSLHYTNKILTCFNPRIERGPEETMTASLLAVDFAADKIFLTNGFGTADPRALTLAIGPKVAETMESYHFLEAPTVHVEGVIPTSNDSDADLHFDGVTRSFQCLRFKVPRVSGQVHWVGDSLTLKNLSADFYHGTAAGSAKFIFPTNRPGADFAFDAVVTNTDIHLLMNDLDLHTNRLEGLLTGRWSVLQGNTEDSKTWQGNGHVSLRDGLIWEFPVFGILSPALDKIAPGLGSSRASEGTASFVMNHGRIRSEDLEIRASGARLEYRGNVDFEGRVEARVQAELLRDTWVVGRILSLALWPVSKIFEYKITGTLNEPKMEPLYFLPKLILIPLHPIESMKELMPKPPDSPKTNAPPVTP